MMAKLIRILGLLLLMTGGCNKDSDIKKLYYYQIGMKHTPQDWRDAAFVVATNNPGLISQIRNQLSLPVSERKMVSGELLRGSGGYNKNAGHEFLWRLDESAWGLVDFTIEIYDGSPYSGVDADTAYWFNVVKRFAPWSSYIAKEITP